MSADGGFSFGGSPSPEELARFDMNDLGNAMRLIRLAGGAIDEDGTVDATSCRLLFQLGGDWIGFNGRHWDRMYGPELARRMAHKVAAEARGLFVPFQAAHGATTKDIMTFIKSCGSAGATTSMLRQAQSYLTVEIDAFDRDPLALNCRNGTLKLRIKESSGAIGRDERGLLERESSGASAGDRRLLLERVLRPHDPADRITKMTAAAYDGGAGAPLFEGVVSASFPIAAEGAYFQRCCGYGSTGITREQAFFLNQGKGRDGKSTLLDAIRKTLGGYAEVGDVMTFLEGMNNNSGGPSPDLVKLSGDVRFVVLSEPKRGAAWNEARLKAWTSGSPITARDLNAKNFNFKPIGKLFVECNPFPKPRGDDDGFWRRIKAILFRRQVPLADIDMELPEKIERSELPGILNWLLAGVEDWLCGDGGKGGLRPPASLEEVLENYRRQSSPFGDWLDACCVWGEAAKGEMTAAGELYADYKTWSEAEGHDKPMSVRAFGDALSDRQVMVVKKDAKGRKVRGPIRLKPQWERGVAEDDSLHPPSGGAGEAAPDAGGPSGSAADLLPPGGYGEDFEPGSEG